MNNIELLKQEFNMSYEDISQKTGLTPTYICYLANGKRKNPSLGVMQRISKAFNKKVEEVFILNKQ